MLNKLNHYGIRGIVNDWFSSYLFKRTQTTEINSFISDKEIVPCGVPQGSVLGPLLFLIFINDIPNSSQKLNFVLFADDTNMLYADKHPKSLEETVNKELKNVCKWLHVNKLTLNNFLSNFVIFRPPQRSLNYEIKLKVIDNSTNISSSLECKEYVKYLGVLIDNHLSWKYDVDYIAVKISKIVGIISRLRHFVPFCTLRSIYQSLILPYLTYGLTAWGQAANTHLNKLLLLQKRALRLMYFLNPRSHAIPSFISSKILPIHLLYLEAILHSMYDVSNNSAPKDISDKFVKTSLIHSYNTRAASGGKYHINFSRLNQQRNSFSCCGAKAWNCLPSRVCNLPKPAFKKSIRKALFAALEGEEDYIEAPKLLSIINLYII